MNFNTLSSLLVLAIFSTVISALEFPQSFSATGNGIYANIQTYKAIKPLEKYQSRPELIKAFCIDANVTMEKGFSIDRMKDDPEAEVTKEMIKDYVKDLRRLSAQKEEIDEVLQKDVQRLVQANNFEVLRGFQEAGVIFSMQTQQVLEAYKQKKKQEELARDRAFIQTLAQKEEADADEPPVQEEDTLDFYKKNLNDLKNELYVLREEGDEEKTACLNDITAINYWIIRVLENDEDDCALMSAIKQMKSYDKVLGDSCGKDSMRYVEWHGRIKPYVGTKLFQAEANCR